MTFSELKEGRFTIRRWGGGISIEVSDGLGRSFHLQGDEALVFDDEFALACDIDEGAGEDFLAEAMANYYDADAAWVAARGDEAHAYL